MARSRRRLIAQSHLAEQPTGVLGRMGVRVDISEEVGFILPLAVLMSLVLLLGSLSMQGVVLQRQISDSILLKSRVRDDGLASSAQVVAGALQLSGSCLLNKDYRKWNDEKCYNAYSSYLTGSIADGKYRVTNDQYSQNDSDAQASSGDLTISWNSGSRETEKTFTISIDSSIDPPRLLGVTP